MAHENRKLAKLFQFCRKIGTTKKFEKTVQTLKVEHIRYNVTSLENYHDLPAIQWMRNESWKRNIYDNGQKDVLLFAGKYRRSSTEENHPKKPPLCWKVVGWLVRWQTASVRNWKPRLTGSARKFPAIIYCYYRGFVRVQLPSVLGTVKFTMKRTTLALNPTGFSNEILLEVPSTLVKHHCVIEEETELVRKKILYLRLSTQIASVWTLERSAVETTIVGSWPDRK